MLHVFYAFAVSLAMRIYATFLVCSTILRMRHDIGNDDSRRDTYHISIKNTAEWVEAGRPSGMNIKKWESLDGITLGSKPTRVSLPNAM